MIFSPQPGKQSAVRETVRGQMTLGDHVANESHSLCVGTLSHARRICRAITLEVFLPTILPCLPPLFACCLPCYYSVLYVYIQLPIVPNLVVINNHNCALTLSFMYNFPIGFLEGFSAYNLCSIVYTMSWSAICML